MKHLVNSFLLIFTFLVSVSLSEQTELILNGSFEKLNKAGAPLYWRFDCPKGYGKISVSGRTAHSGHRCVSISTYVSGAKGVRLVYPNIILTPGWYRVRYSLKAPKGRVAVVQSWLGGDGSKYHSPNWHKIDDKWRDIEYIIQIKETVKGLIINPRYALPWTFYIDDVSVIKIEAPHINENKRSDNSKIHTTFNKRTTKNKYILLFAPINIVDVADNIAEYKQMGFDGFLVPYMPDDINDDIWAIDGDPNTRTPETDKLWREAKRFNDVCKTNGIKHNFIKIGCYKMFPEWNDKANWNAVIEKFRQNAIFAKTTGFRGIAIDPEYIEPQLHAYLGDKKRGIKITNGRNNAVAAYEKYGYQLFSEMLKTWPDMDFIWINDGPLYSSNLGSALFRSFLKALADHKNPNGLHLFVEWTYRKTDPAWICSNIKSRKRWFVYYLTDKYLKTYWNKKCDIGIGLYPIGGGPSCNDWSDRSANYSPDIFRNVLSASLICGGRYTWIYAHGTNWFRVTEGKIQRYKTTAHPAYHNYKSDTGRLTPDIEKYYKVIKELTDNDQF